jgi:hypothetical protein
MGDRKMSTSECCKVCSREMQLERFEKEECNPMTCTVVFPDPPEWTSWMKYENHIERSIFRDLAEKNQIELKDGHNCNFIHVREKMVGGVDYDTEVNLRLHSETSPALVFRRKGTNLMVMVYLHEWER